MKIFTINYWKEVFQPELIIKTTLQTIIGTVMMGAFFMFFSDYVFKPLDLNGRWTLRIAPEEARSEKLGCVDIAYTVLVVQKGLEITAEGEKVEDTKSERGACKDIDIYERKIDPGKGKKIKITGFVNKNYFSDDILTISYLEGEQERVTMGVLSANDKDHISGWYESNISRAKGRITLMKTPEDISQDWGQRKKSFLENKNS
ncbi:MAG: hypothetical protein Q3M24_10530 [Candidatus Electrothrix aestuarii]|uniref:Uncharacterized protein n=1 Tax=Candidatus Electrothrix aestuarii TaxID=3062594 RepID=A0AAU8M1X2_9BACT|nr:hypothetical protein [Candidatus Electrothrix aestuarii]